MVIESKNHSIHIRCWRHLKVLQQQLIFLLWFFSYRMRISRRRKALPVILILLRDLFYQSIFINKLVNQMVYMMKIFQIQYTKSQIAKIFLHHTGYTKSESLRISIPPGLQGYRQQFQFSRCIVIKGQAYHTRYTEVLHHRQQIIFTPCLTILCIQGNRKQFSSLDSLKKDRIWYKIFSTKYGGKNQNSIQVV